MAKIVLACFGSGKIPVFQMGPTIPVLQMVFFSSDRERSLPDLDYIINIDFPPNLQTYMDRLRKGVVHYTLFCREDSKHAERLIYTYN